MQELLDSKLQEFGGEADAYRKKSEDMRRLTVLEKKHKNEELFTKDDLIFLYEINGKIEGFGYEKDPRIYELRKGRNPEEDMLVIFECSREQIAYSDSQINGNTRVYVGKLKKGIFQKLPESLQYIYTSFPSSRIEKVKVEVGGKSANELISELEQVGVSLSDEVKNKIKNIGFIEKKEMTFIRLTVRDFGLNGDPITKHICACAEVFGLALCWAGIVPYYRLKYLDQPIGEDLLVVMKPGLNPPGSFPTFGLSNERGARYDEEKDEYYDCMTMNFGSSSSHQYLERNEKLLFILPNSSSSQL